MKMKKRLLSVLLTTAMVIGMLSVTSYATEGDKTENNLPVFSDMLNVWSKTVLENAVKHGLLKGYDGKIMPNDNLTRAQMATIVNRAFGTTEKTSLSSYTDVAANAWYYDDMAKAVQMKTFVGSGDKLNPDSNISREEAFVVLARAFRLSGSAASALDKFSDKALVSIWAKDGGASLVAAGYVEGSNGQLNPKQNITRAEFAQIMNNLLKNYIKTAGTYTTDINGNVMINVPDVVLKNMTITGDLIIGDGVGNGDVTLDSVVVTGRTIIRGGGVNSIKIIGNSIIQIIIIARVNGQVRVYAEDGTQIGDVVVDGSDDVVIEGNVGTVTITAPDVTVTMTNAEIVSVSLDGDNSKIIIGANSTINTVTVEAKNATITASAGSNIENIVVNSDGAKISGAGKVGTVAANADNITVTTPGTSVAAATGSTGVTAGTTTVTAGSTRTVISESSGSGGDDSTYSTAAPDTVIDIAAIAGVTAPVRGATPVDTITATSEYTATIEWSPAAGTFAENTVYTATITPTQKAGFTLTGVAANFFTVAGATATNAINTGVVTAVFPATTLVGHVPVDLGTAGNYAILAKAGIATVPTSAITGNIGVSPIAATAITGFSLEMDSTEVFSTSSQITGKVYAANYTDPTPSNLTTAISNMETAYTNAAGRAVNYTELYGGDISGKTLAAGVYKWGTDVLINSDVTLVGGANDVWIFQIAQGITQANSKRIILTGGAQAKNIFWQAAETVAIGTTAHFEGTILGMKNITLGTGASINGRLLAQSAVTLDESTVVAPAVPAAAPDTAVTTAAIAGVTAPVRGEVPVATVTETDQYTGSVTWAPDNNPFAATTVYTATTTLTPKAGFTLTGVAADFFTVAGATATNAINTGVVTAVFPATAAVPDTVIDIAAIAGVTAPVRGEVPVATVTEADQYTGSVTWAPDNNPFAATTVYTATIILTPKAGFTLTGVAADFFTVAGATATNAINTGEVTAVFPATGPDPVDLGTAGNYAILAKAGISTVPTSAITGNIGVSPIDATAITGFSLIMDGTGVFSTSSQITGKVYAADYTDPTPSNLTTAISNMETAYTNAAGRAVNYTELYTGDISGQTLTAGVYKWGTGVSINTDVTLEGGANDVWIFQIANGITQASNTRVILTGGAEAKNIFWQAAETVAIGTGAHFEGTILGMTNITLGTGASINGRLLAQTAVTLDANTVVAPVVPAATPTAELSATPTALNETVSLTGLVAETTYEWVIGEPVVWTTPNEFTLAAGVTTKDLTDEGFVDTAKLNIRVKAEDGVALASDAQVLTIATVNIGVTQ